MTGITSNVLTDKLFQDILNQIIPKASLKSWDKIELAADGYISGDGAAIDKKQDRIIGIHGYKLLYILEGSEQLFQKAVVLKCKAPASDVMKFIMCFANQRTNEPWNRCTKYYGLDKTDHTELQFVKTKDPNLVSIMPDIYWNWLDKDNEIFAFAMEYLDPSCFTHLQTIYDLNAWKGSDVISVLSGMAKMHAVYYNNTKLIPQKLLKHLTNKIFAQPEVTKLKSDWKFLLQETYSKNPQDWKRESYDMMLMLTDHLGEIFDVLRKFPVTLIHYDFTTRNLCLRKEVPEGKHQLCLYDWDVVTIGPQQMDLFIFLQFITRPEQVTSTCWDHYIQIYYDIFVVELKRIHPDEVMEVPEVEEFRKLFDMCAIERFLNHCGVIGGYIALKLKVDYPIRVYNVGCTYVESILHRYPSLCQV